MSSIPAKIRTALRDRSHELCEKCGKSYANNAHHRINKSQGGRNVLSNLLMLCGSGVTGCHGWVTEHPKESYENGWSVRSGGDPVVEPVVYRGDRKVLLGDDGSVEPWQVAA